MPQSPGPPNLARTLRRSTLALLVFWLVVAGALWAGFKWHEERERTRLQPYVEANGSLVIPRSPDGHFYVAGEVDHVPVRFLVDTGATNVAISEQTARTAQLSGGEPVILSTAGGERRGRQLRNVPVKVGPLARNDATVTVGLISPAPESALLGQSFLRNFDVRIAGNRMTLSSR
jgi:aspartyl protease family protein